MLTTLDHDNWQGSITDIQRSQAIEALESGQVLYFPKLNFPITTQEQSLLDANILISGKKNVSYRQDKQLVSGVSDEAKVITTQTMMQRYVDACCHLIKQLLPQYLEAIEFGRTSFRPVEVTDRKTSPRQDDSRLHVDAFPATPNQGRRILRVFTNINPSNKPRQWRLGESFPNVAARFLPQLKSQPRWQRKCLKALKITKSYRTQYDNYMLQIHDKMKLDEAYQKSVEQIRHDFPAGSTWLVFTDQVSHAAHAGQFLLEQTFYLPVHTMCNPHLAPLSVLSHGSGQNLLF